MTDLSAEFKALALPIGLRSCWSTPIKNSQGRVLGTFAFTSQGQSPAPTLEATRAAMFKQLDVLLAQGPVRSSAIVDQHFSQRHRLSRLLSALAQRPDLLGVGIDEDTALVIERGQSIEVVGEAFDGHLVLHGPTEASRRAHHNRRVVGQRQQFLQLGDAPT